MAIDNYVTYLIHPINDYPVTAYQIRRFLSEELGLQESGPSSKTPQNNEYQSNDFGIEARLTESMWPLVQNLKFVSRIESNLPSEKVA